MTLTEIFTIIFLHWFADFVLQTDEQARGKSKSWGPLLAHTAVYSLVMVFAIVIVGIIPIVPPYDTKMLLAIPITFLAHTVTDYYTSRINARLWEEKKVHEFFVSVGFDQVLHYIQLFTTYYFLKQIA